MGGKSGFASRVAALILMGSNLLFMTLCAGTFALGLWVITSPSTLSHTIQTFGDATMKALIPRESLDVQLGIVMAVLSIFLFSIALMGFYGAIDRSQFLLFMYSVLVILLLLLECALLFYYTSNISEAHDLLNSSFYLLIENAGLLQKGLQEGDGQLTHALRLIFKCCERNYTSNVVEVIKPPWSCCGLEGFPDNCTADQIYLKDCRETVSSWLDTYHMAIYLPLAVFHIVLSFCSLIRRGSPSRSHS